MKVIEIKDNGNLEITKCSVSPVSVKMKIEESPLFGDWHYDHCPLTEFEDSMCDGDSIWNPEDLPSSYHHFKDLTCYQVFLINH